MLLLLRWDRDRTTERLKFLGYALDVHTFEYMLAKSRKEGHDGEGDVLLILLEPPPQTSDVVLSMDKDFDDMVTHFSRALLSWRMEVLTSFSLSET